MKMTEMKTMYLRLGRLYGVIWHSNLFPPCAHSLWECAEFHAQILPFVFKPPGHFSYIFKDPSLDKCT